MNGMQERGARKGGKGGILKRTFLDVVKKDMQFVGVAEEDAKSD